jgi:hypothetical protein
MRLLGGNIGLSIATIILNARLDADLSSILASDKLNSQSATSTQSHS